MRMGLALLFILFLDTSVSIDKTKGEPLFLFSNCQLEEHTGDIFVIFSEVEISRSFSGNAWVLFSDLKLPAEHLQGRFNLFFSRLYAPRDDLNVGSIIKFMQPLSKLFWEEGSFCYDYRFPSYVWPILLFLFHLFSFYTILAAKKSFTEQGALFLRFNFKLILLRGLITYLLFVLLAGCFLISIAGFPIVILLAAVCGALVCVGQAALCLAFGGALTKYKNMYNDLFWGILAVDLLKLIPIVNVLIYAIFIPVISLGIFVSEIVDGYFRKVFYMSPYNEHLQAEVFQREKIRGIIKGE